MMFHIAIVLCSGCWCIWHFVWRLNAPWNGDFTGIYLILFTSQKWLSPLSHGHTRSEPTSQWEKTVDCAAISGRLNCPKSSLFPHKSIAYTPKTSKKDTRFLSQDWVFPLRFCALNPHGLPFVLLWDGLACCEYENIVAVGSVQCERARNTRCGLTHGGFSMAK